MGGDLVPRHPAMLHKQHGRRILQQRDLPPTAAPHQPQLPVGIKLKRQPLKHRCVVSIVGKIQILYDNLCQCRGPPFVKIKRRKRSYSSYGEQTGQTDPTLAKTPAGRSGNPLLRPARQTGGPSTRPFQLVHAISKWYCASSRLHFLFSEPLHHVLIVPLTIRQSPCKNTRSDTAPGIFHALGWAFL